MKIKRCIPWLVAMTLGIGQAYATIADGTAKGNSELFLSVVDEGAQLSYIRDLGITYTEFVTHSSDSYAFAADANWTTFLGLVGGSTANLIYNVAGLNLQGGTLNRFLTTTNNDMTLSSSRPTNSLLGTSYSSANQYVQQSNLLSGARNASSHGADTATDGSSIAFGNASSPEGDDGLAYFSNGFGRRWALAQAPFDSTASVGTAIAFYELDRSSTNAIARARATVMPHEWLLASNGTLTYGAAPVPEAETWALMLAGLGMVGVARLRRNRS